MIRVVGLDLSLTSTGIARVTVDSDGRCQGVVHVTMANVDGTCTTTVGASLDEGASLDRRWWRMDLLRSKVLGEVGANVDLVVVEGPSYASQHGQQHDRSGFWWFVVDELLARGHAVAEVPPLRLKVWATGSGATSGPNKVTKARVIRDIRKTYGAMFDIPSGAGESDVADAVALVTLGAAHLGHPLADLPTTHRRALAGVRWPGTTEPTLED